MASIFSAGGSSVQRRVHCRRFVGYPAAPTVLKDPAKRRSRIHVDDAGKEAIEKIVAEAGLSGLVVTEPGSA